MSGPAGRVIDLGATSFQVRAMATTGAAGMTLRLDTRPLGSALDWTPRAIAPPAADVVLNVTGLAEGSSLEWRLVEVGATLLDGTHGIVTPAFSLWPTLTATVRTALEGQGLSNDAIYVGRQPDANPSDVVAVLRSQEERQQGGATTQSERWVFPVEVEFRIVATDGTGELQKKIVEDWQRRLEAALHEKHSVDLPGIPGLESARVEITAKDVAGARDQDELCDEIRARATVRFAVWRGR